MYVIVKNGDWYFKCITSDDMVLYTTDLTEAHTFCEEVDAQFFIRGHETAFVRDVVCTITSPTRLTINEIKYEPLRVCAVGTPIAVGQNKHSEDDFATCMNAPQEPEEDVVNHPSHYETGKFECIEVMQEALGYDAVRNFCACNAFKYLYRHKRKNGYEDIKKAQWYLNKYVEITEDAKKNGLEAM